MAMERLLVPVVVGVIRKNCRNCGIRLVFSALVVVSVALTVFTNTKVIYHDDGDPIDAAILSSFMDSPKNKSLPIQPTLESSPPLPLPSPRPSPQNVSVNKVDGAMVLESPSIAAATEQSKPLVHPTNTTIGNNSTLPKSDAALMRRSTRRQNQPAPKKRKKIVRGFQEHELERQLGLTVDFSDFDVEALHHSLEDFYNISTNVTNISYAWDDPGSLLPDWMKKYLRWHASMRTAIRFSNASVLTDETQPFRFIVMQCLSFDENCGGVSDRLKSLPLMLRIAYYTKRMLFIYWNRPGRLEEFLLPPQGGLDWRLPPRLIPMVQKWDDGVFTFSYDTLRGWTRTDVAMVRSRYQDYHGGMYTYNAQLLEGEIDFVRLFHHLWKVSFSPSPPVRQLFESEMTRLGLVPGQYVGAHLRALYALDSRQNYVLRNWARNAMNCASEIRPRKPIFFVSDSDIATKYAREYAAQKNATIITRIPNPNPPFHIDKVDNWRARNMSDFYDSFVDVYILGHADCLTYNKGGYGIMGLYMSRNSTCGLRQDAIDNPQIRNPCIWVDDPLNGTQATRNSVPRNPILSNESIYLEPIDTTYWNSRS